MSETLPIVPEDVAAAATHGSFCPKMCTFACPVAESTGRDDAVPWSFHRTVADAASGRRAVDEHTATHLEACSGCMACQTACVFDQDVPAQVRAGRVAAFEAGTPVNGATAAVAAVEAGRSAFDVELPAAPADRGAPDVVVVAGCRDESASLDALARIVAAAGRSASFVVPDGCCGGVLADLGAADASADAATALSDRLPEGVDVVSTDPHCLPSLRAAAGEGVTVSDVTSYLAGLLPDLDLAGEATEVTFHDPCLLARVEGVTQPPRDLLAAAAATVVEPEGTGERTVCSGAGMALELVAPDAAEATATKRTAQLAATGVPVVTACAGARRRLAASGADAQDLLTFLAARLTTES